MKKYVIHTHYQENPNWPGFSGKSQDWYTGKYNSVIACSEPIYPVDMVPKSIEHASRYDFENNMFSTKLAASRSYRFELEMDEHDNSNPNSRWFRHSEIVPVEM